MRELHGTVLWMVALVAALVAPSCSLVVSDLRPGECTTFMDCDGLNDRDGLDALTCELWTCDRTDHFCHRRSRDRDGDGSFGPYPRGSTCTYTVSDCDDEDAQRSLDGIEECDGIDNDCDLIIDETLVDATVPAFVARTALGPFTMGDGATAPSIGFPASQEATARTAIVSHLTAGSFVGESIVLEGTAATEALSYEHACGGPTTPQCVTDATDCTSTVTCEIGDPALDVLGAGDVWLAAADSIACSGGGSDIRVGTLVGAALHQEGMTTVAGSPDCAAGPASRPTLSGLVTGTATLALVAYLAEPVSASRSCGTPVGVRALVVRQTPNGLEIWSGPFDVGTTTSTSAPAVVAVAPSGWVIGLSATAGTSLSWVSSVMGTSSSTAIGTLGTEGPGDVRLAGELVGGRLDLGVLRMAGCDSGPVTFGTASIDPASPGASPTTRAPSMLAASGRGLALVRVSGGLVLEGFERGGNVAGADTLGGWVAGWSDAASNGATHAQRILALDGEAVGDAVDVPGLLGDAAWLARASATSGHVVDYFVLRDDRTLAPAALFCL